MPIKECILVGGKPKWYKGFHVEHKDYGIERKEENIRDKVIAGAELLGGEFLFSNDDIFLLDKYQGVLNKGLLSETLATRNKNGSYGRLLKNTIDMFGDVDNVDTHYCMFMDSEGVKKTKFDWPLFGVGFKTCYAVKNNIKSIYYPDLKISEPCDISNRKYFTTTPSFKTKFLHNLFPDPCIFEK